MRTYIKNIDHVGRGEIITTRQGGLALVLDVLFGEDAKAYAFSTARVVMRPKEFTGDQRADDYLMMPVAIKNEAGLRTDHQYQIFASPEELVYKNCLSDGMGNDVICHGNIAHQPIMRTLDERAKYLQSLKKNPLDGIVSARKPRKSKAKPPSIGYDIDVDPACDLECLIPMFKVFVKTNPDGTKPTLRALWEAAKTFRSTKDPSSLNNMIDPTLMGDDFLLVHAMERSLLTDQGTVDALRRQGVHDLPMAFRFAGTGALNLTTEQVQHIKTQPFAPIADEIIAAWGSFMGMKARNDSRLNDKNVKTLEI